MAKTAAKTPSVYEELSAWIKLKPNKDEDEQTFLKRFVAKGSEDDDMSDEAFAKFSNAAQDWYNKAILAIQQKKPIIACPGAPEFAGPEEEEEETAEEETAEEEEEEEAEETAEEEEEDPPPAPRAKLAGKPAAAAKPATKPATKPAVKGAAKPAEKPADKPSRPPRDAKPAERRKPSTEQSPKKTPAGRPAGGDGVLHLLLQATHADPNLSPADLARVVEKQHKIEVKPANAIGVRQQYRRIVKFLQDAGELKRKLL